MPRLLGGAELLKRIDARRGERKLEKRREAVKQTAGTERQRLKERLVRDLTPIGSRPRIMAILVSSDPAMEPRCAPVGYLWKYSPRRWALAGVYNALEPTFSPRQMMADIAVTRAVARSEA